MADPDAHLGLVLRLLVDRDDPAIPDEPILRDRLTCEVLRMLRRLPADIDAAQIRRVAQEILVRYTQVVSQTQGGSLPAGAVVDLDLAAVAVSLIEPAWTETGYSLFGYRWRLVSHVQPDAVEFDREVAEADRQLARWLARR